METILRGFDVDIALRWPNRRAEKLAKKGLIPHLILPDGSIRFRQSDIEAIVRQAERLAQCGHPGLRVSGASSQYTQRTSCGVSGSRGMRRPRKEYRNADHK